MTFFDPTKTNIPFIQYRKILISISVVLIAASIALLATKGLNFGVDFTGGGQRVLAGGRLTIRIWQLLYVGAASAVDFIKTEKRLRDNKKHDSERNDSNGKPGRRYDGKNHVEDKGNGGRQHDSGNAYNNA